MRTVKSEKEKERIRERVEEIGGKSWDDGYKEIADALDSLDELTRRTKDSADAVAETMDTLGDSLTIAARADSASCVKRVVAGDTRYVLRPDYDDIEDIYHQWFPEDGDAPFTKEVFKALPKRIIASALETVIASEITEMLLSLTSVKRRDHDTPFLSHFKKRITDLRKRFSLNLTNISTLTLGELERNFALPRNDSYYSLLSYLFGPDPNVPSIKEFVVAKHPMWFPCSLDEPWRIFIHATGMIETMTTREIVERLATGSLSEEDAFKTLPGNVRDFIKKEVDKYKLEADKKHKDDEYIRKFIYGDWGVTSGGAAIDDGGSLTDEEGWWGGSVLDCLREMCDMGMTEEPTEDHDQQKRRRRLGYLVFSTRTSRVHVSHARYWKGDEEGEQAKFYRGR